MSADRQRLWAGALLLALALHAAALTRPGWQGIAHLLWSCHIATATLALGLLTRSRQLAWAGFLFHLSIGFPAWLVEVVASRGTFGAAARDAPLLATSALVHILPLAAGFTLLGIARPPRRAITLAWSIPLALLPVSRALTPPGFNVNLAFAVWPPMSGWFPRLWIFQAAFSVASLGLLLVAALLLEWVQRVSHARTGSPVTGSAA